MTTRRRIRRKREKMLETLILTSMVALGVLLVLVVGHIYVSCSIYQNQHSIEVMSKELDSLQGEINTVIKEQEEYEKQIAQLQTKLAQYQDIIVPESMQLAQ
ncbi:MAG: hypothetical protein E7231_17140 [Cellulosilyticum sp.]|nr:hypothetical protein [Cellulosilyticum sp.]